MKPAVVDRNRGIFVDEYVSSTRWDARGVCFSENLFNDPTAVRAIGIGQVWNWVGSSFFSKAQLFWGEDLCDLSRKIWTVLVANAFTLWVVVGA